MASDVHCEIGTDLTQGRVCIDSSLIEFAVASRAMRKKEGLPFGSPPQRNVQEHEHIGTLAHWHIGTHVCISSTTQPAAIAGGGWRKWGNEFWENSAATRSASGLI